MSAFYLLILSILLTVSLLWNCSAAMSIEQRKVSNKKALDKEYNKECALVCVLAGNRVKEVLPQTGRENTGWK